MCGRYAAAKDPNALVEEFEVAESVIDKPLKPDFNVAPTKDVYGVLSRRARDGAVDGPVNRQLRVLRWGLVPSWAKDIAIGSRLINARVETVAEKPAFKRAFAARRCLLPADGYYEWYTSTEASAPKNAKGKPLKQPFFIRRSDGKSLAMAGLYEWWLDQSKEREDPDSWMLSTVIITTTAADDLGQIHDRMPLLVDEGDWHSWLDPDVGQTDQVQELLRPAMSYGLEVSAVSTQVNNVKNNGPELIDPLPLAGEPDRPVGAH